MRKVIVTAFDPFGGDETNSSQIVLSHLPDVYGDVELVKITVPTVYDVCADIALKKATECGAEAVLAMGQAGGRRAITPEAIAVNYALSETPDNKGEVRLYKKLSEDGENAYFSTLLPESCKNAIAEAGAPSYVSVSAGAFVCNSMLYFLLKNAPEGLKCTFLHLPYAKEQNKDEFSMDGAMMAQCISHMIEKIFILKEDQ